MNKKLKECWKKWWWNLVPSHSDDEGTLSGTCFFLICHVRSACGGKGHSSHGCWHCWEMLWVTHSSLSQLCWNVVCNSRGLSVPDWIHRVLVWFCGKWQLCMCFLCFCLSLCFSSDFALQLHIHELHSSPSVGPAWYSPEHAITKKDLGRVRLSDCNACCSYDHSLVIWGTASSLDLRQKYKAS